MAEDTSRRLPRSQPFSAGCRSKSTHKAILANDIVGGEFAPRMLQEHTRSLHGKVNICPGPTSSSRGFDEGSLAASNAEGWRSWDRELTGHQARNALQLRSTEGWFGAATCCECPLPTCPERHGDPLGYPCPQCSVI